MLHKLTLRHLFINNEKKIGFQFQSNKVIELIIKNFDNPKWSKIHHMPYIENTPSNLQQVFTDFKGIAWVNCKYFLDNKPLNKTNESLNLSKIRLRNKTNNIRKCPEEYLIKLELKKYASNTANIYVSLFEKFINFYHDIELLKINENDIRRYLLKLIEEKKSNSYLNQMINSIKFYYEIVLGMPNRFYDIERPRKEFKLPKTISKFEVKKMISVTKNIKHKCIISLLYSAGLRRSELIDLKLSDIDSNQMIITIKNAKGAKDRNTLLGESVLKDLRLYYKVYRPKFYLFEGINNQKYSSSSVLNIVKNAGLKASVTKKVTPHMLRHSFATHLLEDGVNLRYIQFLLGHSTSKTTEIYTYVATNNIKEIKNLLD